MVDKDKFFAIVDKISATRYFQTDEEWINIVTPKVTELNEYISQVKSFPKTPNKFQKLFLNERFNKVVSWGSLGITACLVIFLLATPDKALQNKLGFVSIMGCLFPGYIWIKSTHAIKKNLNLPTD
jgi:uncharacterized MnhB-related membrane protein